MKPQYLRWDQTLFRDAEVFEYDHLPDAFRHRERQMKELAFLVAPGLRGGRPLSAICYGLPGTGKTTCMRKLFAEIEETTRSLVPVYINCQVDHTKLMVFSKIYQKLTGHLPQTNGVSLRKVLDAIARHMTEEGRVLVVCLDDANFMQGDRTAIFSRCFLTVGAIWIERNIRSASSANRSSASSGLNAITRTAAPRSCACARQALIIASISSFVSSCSGSLVFRSIRGGRIFRTFALGTSE